jgi:hypothetical protein
MSKSGFHLMPEAADDLRFKARRCRELSRGLDEETRLGLLKLADDYEAEAQALEAAAPKPAQAKLRNEPPPGN